jgi:hypothetical protein
MLTYSSGHQQVKQVKQVKQDAQATCQGGSMPRELGERERERERVREGEREYIL